MVRPDSRHVISTYCQRGVKRSLKELVVGENLLDFSFLEISGLRFSLLSSESSGGFRPCRQALAPWNGRPVHGGESRKERAQWGSQDSSSAQSQKTQDQSVGLEKENQGDHIVFLLHTQPDVGSSWQC